MTRSEYDITTDQYSALPKLSRWFESRHRQMISISSPIGTMGWEFLQYFLEYQQIQPNEVMYLSMDQKMVMELACDQLHAYYLNRVLYSYDEMVDLDSVPFMGKNYDGHIRTTWKRMRNKHISEGYKLIVVLDASLLSYEMIRDICKFNRKVLLLYDPFMVSPVNSYCEKSKPDVSLEMVHPSMERNPFVVMAYKVLGGNPVRPGEYGGIHVIPSKSMNLSNLRSNEMNLTISKEMADRINVLYRDKIMKGSTDLTHVGERLIVSQTLHDHAISSRIEPRLCFYFVNGMVGEITKINRHVARTKYVPFEFTPEWGDQPFTGMSLDRNFLNHVDYPSRQIIPKSIAKMSYAYGLSILEGRVHHWDTTTLISEGYDGSMLHNRMMYTAIANTRKRMTIVV